MLSLLHTSGLNSNGCSWLVDYELNLLCVPHSGAVIPSPLHMGRRFLFFVWSERNESKAFERNGG